MKQCVVLLFLLAHYSLSIDAAFPFFKPTSLRDSTPRPKQQLRNGASDDSDICYSHPLPAVSADVLLSNLQPFLDQVEKNISKIFSGAHGPPGGAALAVVYDQDVIWTKGFGLTNDSDPSRGPPTGSTAFRIGSITKLFTALMMLQLRDEALLRSLDEDVTAYNKEFSVVNPFETDRGVTFRQLSSHMGGLPRETPCKDIFIHGCYDSDEEIYGNLAKLKLLYPPGQIPSYSNLGFGLLGRTLQKIEGPTWEEQVEKKVLKPLGMTHTGNNITEEVKKYLAVGYYGDGSEAKLVDIGWEAPAGQMFSTTSDLAKLMKLLFRMDKKLNVSAGQILDGETIREWVESPAYIYRDGSGYGHPWELLPYGNHTMRTKAGAINGYLSEFQMAPEIKTGIILLQGLDESEVVVHNEILAIGQQAILEASRVLYGLQPPPSQPADQQEYEGGYRSEYGELYVTTRKLPSGYSVLAMEGLEGWMEFKGGDTFQLTRQGMDIQCSAVDYGLLGEYVEFQRDSSTGSITSFTIPGLQWGTYYERTQTL